MEQLLQGIPGVIPYFDDMLMSATSCAKLLERLREVLKWLQQMSLKVKRNKCHVAVSQVEFLSFLVDGQGLHPTPTKMQAIKDTSTPTFSMAAEFQRHHGKETKDGARSPAS